IWVRVTNNENFHNYGITSFYLFVYDLPTPNTNNTPLVSCELMGAGVAQFDLDANYNNIVGTYINLSVSYYLEESHPHLGYNYLQLPLSYTGPAGNIYARVENEASGCYVVLPLELQIFSHPVVTEIAPLVMCDQFNDRREIF